MKIEKILIANRGEIALRVIRTCREMGIKTVALCPQKGLEEDFLETQLADEFCYLERDGLLGYLDQKRLIALAKEFGCQAIHPGYGFLSENSDFAALCQSNGIKFVGPSASIIKKLGDKIEAKRIAKECGLPILPSTLEAVKDAKECAKYVKEIGLPCMLKAVDGGGGIGIEVIDKNNFKNLEEIFLKLQRLAQNAFGSSRIFIERYLVGPRHIEFQIIGDGQGNVIWLPERECSIQRRHQKLFEEAPSVFIDNFLRLKMGGAAVKIGKFLKYEGVGTVEFLVDKDKKFYFGEVNPRLQVEHTITEAITNIDLVEQQLLIASGEKLKINQWQASNFSGHAFELRICAEDPCHNFQPQSGLVHKYLAPGGRGVEMHTFLQSGQHIFPFFDSMIAKMVVFGNTRQQAIKRALRALNELRLEGIKTNIPFHKTLLSNAKFQKGEMSTKFIEEEKIIENINLVCEIDPKKKAQEKETISFDDLAYILSEVYKELHQYGVKGAAKNNWKTIHRFKMTDKHV